MRRLRPDIGFGAFISYSGQEDRALIVKLQNGIEKLAKRWYRPPIMKVFVDKTSIAAGTRLWSRIEYGLERSMWLILMASPEAAQSWWVEREVDWWLRHRSLDNVIVVQTAGSLSWDRALKDFSVDSDSVPPCLRGKFDDEPVWVVVPRTDRGPNVESAVLSITAAVRQMPIHELSSQAYREHRRTVRWAGGAITILALLLVAAVVLSVVAVVQKDHADEQARVALSRQLASTSANLLFANPRAALQVAVSAYRTDANPQTLAALMRADTENPRLVRYFSVDGSVSELSGSGDGKTIVAGLADGRVLRWNLADAKPTAVLRLSSAISSLSVNNDASVIAASDSSRAQLWRSGRDPLPLPVPVGQSPDAVTVSPSGRTAVVSSSVAQAFEGDQSIAIFDAPSGSQRGTYAISGKEMTVAYLAASSDEDVLVFDDRSGRWQQRRIPDWSLVGSGNIGLGIRQRSSKPSVNGEFVAATNGATTIPVWRLSGPQPFDPTTYLTALAPITQPADSLSLSPNGTALAIADAGSLYVAPVAPADAVVPAAPIPGQETASGLPVRSPTVQLPGAGAVRSSGLVRFLGDDSHLLSATGSQIAFWDLHQIDRLARAAKTVLQSDPCNACSGASVSVSPDGKHAALMATSTAAIEPLPGVVGLSHRFPAPCFPGPLVGGVGSACGIPLWRDDGRLIIAASGQASGSATYPDAVRVLAVPGGQGVMAAALDAAERNVVAVDSRGSLFTLDAETGQVRDETLGPPRPRDGTQNVQDADINSAADLIARVKTTTSDDLASGPRGSVSIFDLRHHHDTGAIPGDDVTSARFAGRSLLVQRQNGNLEVWDDHGSVMARVIGGDRSYYYPPVADTRGQLIARLRNENSVEIFDLSTGTQLDSIPALTHADKTGRAFSPNGDALVMDIARWDKNDLLLVRDLSSQALLAAACAASGSKLSRDEWLALVGITPDRISTCD